LAVDVEGTPVPPAPRVRPRARNARRVWIAGGVILVALGFLVYRGLDNATLYFRTAAEAVEQRGELGTRRFRIEGNVVQGSVNERGDTLDFKIESGGTVVNIVHRGNQPALFKPGIPVVLEGRFADRSLTFNSDRMLVKHSESYVAENPDRVTTTAPAP